MADIRKEEHDDSVRKKYKKRKNMESNVSGEEENKDGRRKKTKKEVLVDVSVSEAVSADNWFKKVKKKKYKNSEIGEEENNDGREMRKHHRGEGVGKGVSEVLGSSEAEVLDDSNVPEVERTDARSKKEKEKKKKKKDKNIATAEDQKKKKKSKHTRGRADSEGTLNVLESSKGEVLGDISVPEIGITEIGITDAVSKKKKKKDKKMVIAEDQKSPEKKRKRKEKGGEGDEEIISKVVDPSKTVVMGDTSFREVGIMDAGSKKEKRKKDKTRVTLEDQKNHVKERKRQGGGDERDEEGISEGLEASETVVLGHPGVPEVGSTDNGSKKDKKTKKNEEIHGVTENKETLEDKKLKDKEKILGDGRELEHAEGKKRKKKKLKDSGGCSPSKKLSTNSLVHSDNQERNEAAGCAGTVEDQINSDSIENMESVKKRKKKKKADLGAASISEQNNSQDESTKERDVRSVSSDAIASLANGKDRASGTSGKSNLKKKSKKVRFAEDVEVFNLSENLNEEEVQHKNKKKSSDSLIRGKRFSREEDEIIRKAVLKYVEDHQLGDEGLQMVMKCKEHKELKDCWKEIAEALPSRPYEAVYYRAHILFERAESRKWTEEELDLVREYHAKHGSNWRAVGDELGKHRVHVKDAYRRIKLANQKKGHWSQQEYQALFDLVNTDLQMKAFMDKKLKHGMLRDNISWKGISNKLSTRTEPRCCLKWYDQLCSPLVKEQKWADTDDYRLMTALAELDASCEEDVDWDSLLEHRSGDVCRKRWSEMVRHIGEHGLKSFSDQVDTLSQRYCPDLLEVREAYASKTAVD